MTWYVVDGMDGSGKSTAAEFIAERLRSEGRTVRIVTHPSRDRLSGRMELALLKKEGKAALLFSVLFYIVDVLQSLFRMRFAKDGPDDMIFVRYMMAVAYLPEKLCPIANDVISHVLPTPDVAVLVDVDPGTAMARIVGRGEDLEVYETPEKLEKVRRKMLSLADGWTVLDNSGDEEALRKQMEGRLFGHS